MIDKDALIAIREGFKAHHKVAAQKPGVEIDFDPLLGMIPLLIELVEQHVTDKVIEARKWLIDLIIKKGVAPTLLTIKDAVIYVLTVIDAVLAGKETVNA